MGVAFLHDSLPSARTEASSAQRKDRSVRRAPSIPPTFRIYIGAICVQASLTFVWNFIKTLEACPTNVHSDVRLCGCKMVGVVDFLRAVPMCIILHSLRDLSRWNYRRFTATATSKED
eukprot:6203092-Pleurochrysis_carterae.AAC.3